MSVSDGTLDAGEAQNEQDECSCLLIDLQTFSNYTSVYKDARVFDASLPRTLLTLAL